MTDTQKKSDLETKLQRLNKRIKEHPGGPVSVGLRRERHLLTAEIHQLECRIIEAQTRAELEAVNNDKG